jgi:hypothetical protein
MNIMGLQEKLVGIISLLIIEDDEKEINNLQKEALEIINNRDFKVHINDDIKGHTILDDVKKCSIGVGQGYVEKKGLSEIEKAIKDSGGKTSEELGRVSSFNNGSELESELSSNEESEDEDIVIDHQARRECQTFQQNINSAKSCSILSAITFIATTGMLVGRTFSSIEHEEESELMSIPVLFLSCLNLLSLGLIFDSNRVIRSNRDQVHSLLENTADQQIIQQTQSR